MSDDKQRCQYNICGRCKKHKYLYELDGRLYCSKHYDIMIGDRLENKLHSYDIRGRPICHRLYCESEDVRYIFGGYFCHRHIKEIDDIRRYVHCGDRELEYDAHLREFEIRKSPCHRHSRFILSRCE